MTIVNRVRQACWQIEDSLLTHKALRHDVGGVGEPFCRTCERQLNYRIVVTPLERRNVLRKHGPGVMNRLQRVIETIGKYSEDDRRLGFAANGAFKNSANIIACLPRDVRELVNRTTGPCPPRIGFHPKKVTLDELILFVPGATLHHNGIEHFRLKNEEQMKTVRHAFDPFKGLYYTDIRAAEFAFRIRELTLKDLRKIE